MPLDYLQGGSGGKRAAWAAGTGMICNEVSRAESGLPRVWLDPNYGGYTVGVPRAVQLLNFASQLSHGGESAGWPLDPRDTPSREWTNWDPSSWLVATYAPFDSNPTQARWPRRVSHWIRQGMAASPLRRLGKNIFIAFLNR